MCGLNSQSASGREKACICICTDSRWRARVSSRPLHSKLSQCYSCSSEILSALLQALRPDRGIYKTNASAMHKETMIYTRGDAAAWLVRGTLFISSVTFRLPFCVSHVQEAILHQRRQFRPSRFPSLNPWARTLGFI